MYRFVFMSIITCLIFTSCAKPLAPNQVRVTFSSIPEGAMIYEGEKAWGVAPVTLIYTVNDDAVRKGYFTEYNMFALWPSGAKHGGAVGIQVGEGSREVTFSRPSDAPGLDKDLSFAAQLELIEAAKEEAAAASVNAFWETYNSTYKAFSPE